MALDARAVEAGGRRRSPTRSACRCRTRRQGIVDIVNENMVGALRLVSVEQGYDPRDFALIAFGGAGPLHANALAHAARLLAGRSSRRARACCAPTAMRRRALRDEAARTFIRKFSETTPADSRDDPGAAVGDRRAGARAREACRAPSMKRQLPGRRALPRPGHAADDRRGPRRRCAEARPEGDLGAVRRGCTSGSSPSRCRWSTSSSRLRAVVQGRGSSVRQRRHRARRPRPEGRGRSARSAVYVDGRKLEATVYDRAKLKAGNRVARPGDRHRNGLDHADPAEARRRRRPPRQHPDLPGFAQEADRRARRSKTHARKDHPGSKTARSARSRSTRSRSTSSRARCATRASRWTRCCSAPRCRPASASSTTSFR